jgi:hypothetical protein
MSELDNALVCGFEEPQLQCWFSQREIAQSTFHVCQHGLQSLKIANEFALWIRISHGYLQKELVPQLLYCALEDSGFGNSFDS